MDYCLKELGYESDYFSHALKDQQFAVDMLRLNLYLIRGYGYRTPHLTYIEVSKRGC